MSDIERACDQLLILHRGRLIVEGDLENIKEQSMIVPADLVREQRKEMQKQGSKVFIDGDKAAVIFNKLEGRRDFETKEGHFPVHSIEDLFIQIGKKY